MKKLRLLFTEKCNRNCEGCCNKDWNLEGLKKVKHFNYEEILITGGEPLLFSDKLIGLVAGIRVVSDAKIFVYTAMTVSQRTFKPIYDIINVVDGLTLTLHDQQDASNLKHVLYSIENDPITKKAFEGKSLRLNVFEGIDTFGMNLSDWNVKADIKWIKKCPLPDDEDFRKMV